jgi:phospholipase C
MENQSANDIVGNPDTPYLNSLIAQGTRFTNYTEGDPTGPSLPDYLEVAAGSRCGVSTDDVSAGQFDASQGCGTTVWNQLQAAGVSWSVFMDAMPSACYSESTYSNITLDTPYALKHNPATPFASIFNDDSLCAAHVLPFTSFNPGALPAVSFVAPGICNDHHGSKSTQWHDCLPKSPGLYARGDTWLRDNIGPAISAGADVFITYDESGVLYAVGVGPSFAAGTTDARAFDHYSTLAGIEDTFGLTRLNNAANATPLPISP